MATILPIQSQSFPQQQQSMPQQTAPQSNDPLFEALVKYITSGPGPSSATSAQVQEILESHINQPGGRAYLESIVSPGDMGQIKMWKNHATAKGFVSTNLSSMTVYFTATRNNIFQQLEFRGTCPGFFPPQVFEMGQTSTFYWDDLTDNMPVKMTVRNLASVSMFTVQFYGSDGQAVGELILENTTLRLPDHEISGTGMFKLPNGPQ